MLVLILSEVFFSKIPLRKRGYIYLNYLRGMLSYQRSRAKPVMDE